MSRYLIDLAARGAGLAPNGAVSNFRVGTQAREIQEDAQEELTELVAKTEASLEPRATRHETRATTLPSEVRPSAAKVAPAPHVAEAPLAVDSRMALPAESIAARHGERTQHEVEAPARLDGVASRPALASAVQGAIEQPEARGEIRYQERAVVRGPQAAARFEHDQRRSTSARSHAEFHESVQRVVPLAWSEPVAPPARDAANPSPDFAPLPALLARLETLLTRFEAQQRASARPTPQPMALPRSPGPTSAGFSELSAQRRHADRRWY